MNRNFFENLYGIQRTTYAWRIDTWESVDGDPMGEGIVEGPESAPEDLLEQVRAGKGIRFRMLDDDGNVYCKGRLAIAETTEDLGYAPEFGPLDDYGSGGLGCTEIHFWMEDPTTGTHKWVVV